MVWIWIKVHFWDQSDFLISKLNWTLDQNYLYQNSFLDQNNFCIKLIWYQIDFLRQNDFGSNWLPGSVFFNQNEFLDQNWVNMTFWVKWTFCIKLIFWFKMTFYLCLNNLNFWNNFLDQNDVKIQISNKQIIIKSFWHENCYFFEKSKCHFSFGKIKDKKLTEHDNVLAENHFYRSSNYQFNCVTLHLTFYVHLSSHVQEIQLNHDYPK